jgi:hypothetical protein
MKEKKRKVGRPKLPKNQVKNVIAIRLTNIEKRTYEERASKLGMSLSDWVRQTLENDEEMKHITLAVTEAVVHQVQNAGKSQRQIAIRDASPELLASIQNATAVEPTTICMLNAFELVVGDTSAIWPSHQQTQTQAEDFRSIYELLERRPDHSVRFTW